VTRDGLDFRPRLTRWKCYGYRFEAEGKVIAISGDTIPAQASTGSRANADVLVHCCYMTTAESRTSIFAVSCNTRCPPAIPWENRARANAKTLVLTHHRRAKTSGCSTSSPRRWHRFCRADRDCRDLTELEV